MGLFHLRALRVSSVAVGTGEIVAGVEQDFLVAAPAAGRAGESFWCRWLFWSLALSAARKDQGQQAEKRQKCAIFWVEAKRHGGQCILGAWG
ncbi:MAG: hypothetical protein A2505_09870 [Deltaproteobacteria bacterium RIFOXYD12_FULL_55_16]|nr:MAG: hypothetical protein A2505_09870 [Deltaproteobacteria bacterium RIFOXYD12_FULL_55_16]